MVGVVSDLFVSVCVVSVATSVCAAGVLASSLYSKTNPPLLIHNSPETGEPGSAFSGTRKVPLGVAVPLMVNVVTVKLSKVTSRDESAASLKISPRSTCCKTTTRPSASRTSKVPVPKLTSSFPTRA